MGVFSKFFSRFNAASGDGGLGERRACYRQAVDCLAVAMFGGRSSTVQVENISAGGAFISPRLEAAKGSYITLRIPDAGMTLKAQVAQHSNRGTGIYFQDSSAGENIIERFSVA